MKKMRNIIKMLRVKQWMAKNTFVLAGIIFAGKFTDIIAWQKTGIAFLSFCFAASCIYIINDIADRQQDRQHPEKCKRPIASGEIKVVEAIITSVILFALAIALPILIGSYSLLYCIISYLIMMLAYSYYLKNIVILDVMIIAIGFLLRAVAGVVTIKVEMSPWLILCTALLALFLALNKRHGELIKLGAKANTRKVLNNYSKESIKEMLSIITPALVVSYALYTINSPMGNVMLLTLPFVIYGLFRYIYIADKLGIHDSPDAVLFKDLPLLIDVALWAIASGIIIFFTML